MFRTSLFLERENKQVPAKMLQNEPFLTVDAKVSKDVTKCKFWTA